MAGTLRHTLPAMRRVLDAILVLLAALAAYAMYMP